MADPTPEDSTAGLEARLAALRAAGVRLVDPRQCYVAPDVALARIHRGAVLHPGTRLVGARTWLGSGAEVGTEGPATLVDCALDEGASVASGFVTGAVLLRRASLGANSHVRAGTLLEEEASTAHAVGLKQTILLSFVTLGSLINFCDCLMAGGTSRQDHSEVGSGYIHFNFTPWGKHGDKATASLIGDVARGVFLRQPRIFLGGTGGLVGPARVEYGAIAGAGQIVRGGIRAHRLVLAPPPVIDREVVPGWTDRVQPRAARNIAFLAELVALREWYRQVRRPTSPEPRRPVVDAALENLEVCLKERLKQLNRFLEERSTSPLGLGPADLPGHDAPSCPLDVSEVQADHVAWVRALGDDQVAAGTEWLEGIAERVRQTATASLE